jgi:hypothetical protein
MLKLSGLIADLKAERDQAQKTVDQLNAVLITLGGLGPSGGTSAADARRREPMSTCSKTNCRSSTSPMGKWKALQRRLPMLQDPIGVVIPVRMKRLTWQPGRSKTSPGTEDTLPIRGPDLEKQSSQPAARS